ncbi:MAG: hypothetical protein GYB31_15540 [Bacteroidetes bacterium]|nr:hypothetical protein [Bacteroidota bacterium]
MQPIKFILGIAALAIGITSCADDDNDMMPDGPASFKVSIENTLPTKDYLNSGTTGLIMPGEEEVISFHAGQGMYLSLATMFVASNDLFFGFEETGLALYDADGNALSGDVASSLLLWDAGTEVNEEPGNGPNQPANQGNPDTGMDENGVVHVNDDGFTYPTITDLISLELEHDGGTGFTLTISNNSDATAIPNPYAPGVWVVHGSGTPVFTEGTAASEGLEDLAEDGDNSITAGELEEKSGYTSPFAPGVFAVHESGTAALFTSGSPDRGAGLEALAEDGDPSALAASLDADGSLLSSGAFNTPEGASDPGPLMPGQSYTFSFEAEAGAYLNFATMLIHTNDLFYAFGANGIALFNGDDPITGDLTSSVSLWDAGTEVNEYPGAGNSQPARGGADSGTDENGNVRKVDDGFTYPTVSEAIKVTIVTE